LFSFVGVVNLNEAVEILRKPQRTQRAQGFDVFRGYGQEQLASAFTKLVKAIQIKTLQYVHQKLTFAYLCELCGFSEAINCFFKG